MFSLGRTPELTPGPTPPPPVGDFLVVDSSGDVGIGTTSPVPGQGLTIAPPPSTSGTPSLLTVTGPAHTGLTGEANDVNLALARVVTFSSVSAGAQRAVLVQPPSYASSPFIATLGTAATVDIAGAPGTSGTNLTITNSYGLNIEANSLSSSVTNGYGLAVAAPTSASNDYAAQFVGPVSGAVGNPSGLLPASTSTYPGTVFHMDGTKYSSIDSIFTTFPGLPNNSAVTIYDDCPGGSEPMSNDPFHPSNSLLYHVHIISAPCVYQINTPIHLKTGDSWWGAGSGLYAPSAALYAGTVWQMGLAYPAPITSPPSVPTSPSLSGASGTGGWTPGNYYWVGITAENGAGETPLTAGNYSNASYAPTGTGLLATNSFNQMSFTLPPITGSITGYCVYVLQSALSGFPTNTDPVGQQCGLGSGPQTLNSYTANGNPPPDTNTTGSLITMGNQSNYNAATNTGMWFGNGAIDCNGGALSIGITNNSAQDPGSAIASLQAINCLGDAAVEVLGYDGNAGGNGSSIFNFFLLNSNCSGTHTCSGGGAGLTTEAFPNYGIHIFNVSNMKSIQNVDIGADSCGTSSSCTLHAGIRLDNGPHQNSASKVQVFAVHCEGNLSLGGVTYEQCIDDNGVPATIDGVHTDGQIRKSVHIESGTVATSVRDVVPASNRAAIWDEVNSPFPYKSPLGQAIGEYDIEQAGNFLNVAGNSNLFGGLTLGTGGLSTPSVTDSGLMPGDCVQASTGGALSTIASPCGTVTSVAAGTGLTGGTITGSGTIALSTPVAVSNGGTGASSLGTSGNVLLGNGSSAISASTNTVPSSAPSLDNSMLLFDHFGAGSMVRGPQVFNGGALSPAGSTPVTIGTFSNSVDSGASYYLFCDLQAAASSMTSSGLKVGIGTGGATATSAFIGLQGINATVSATGSGFGTFIGGNSGGTTTLPYHFSASIVINAGGTLAVQYESLSSNNVTIESYACVLQ